MKENMELEKDNFIALALPKENVASIIMDFLGSKEKLTYSKDGYFQLSIGDLQQYYYLIEQKINKEYSSYLDFFEVVINYDDGTSRKINNKESLESYHESRLVCPISVIIQWNIILKFPSSKTIENQKIEILFDTNDENSCAKVVVEYTNLVWGSEVINLLINQVNKNVYDLNDLDKKHNKRSKSKLLDNYQANILFVLAAIFFIILYFKYLPVEVKNNFSLDKSNQKTFSALSINDIETLKESDIKEYARYQRFIFNDYDINAIEENKELYFFGVVEKEKYLYELFKNRINILEEDIVKIKSDLYFEAFNKVDDIYDAQFIVDTAEDYKYRFSLENFITEKNIRLIKISRIQRYNSRSANLIEKMVNFSYLKAYFENLSEIEFYKRCDEYNRKINKIIAYGFLLIAALFFIGILLPILTVIYSRAYIKYNKKKSFLLITDLSMKNAKEFESQKNRLEFYSYKGVVFAILTGLISSFIYSIITIVSTYLVD